MYRKLIYECTATGDVFRVFMPFRLDDYIRTTVIHLSRSYVLVDEFYVDNPKRQRHLRPHEVDREIKRLEEGLHRRKKKTGSPKLVEEKRKTDGNPIRKRKTESKKSAKQKRLARDRRERRQAERNFDLYVEELLK